MFFVSVVFCRSRQLFGVISSVEKNPTKILDSYDWTKKRNLFSLFIMNNVQERSACESNGRKRHVKDQGMYHVFAKY